MGAGEFGSNGSLHWTVADDDTPGKIPVGGVDSIKHGDIGQGKNHAGGPKPHKGFLRVRLRFPDMSTATSKLQDAIASARPVAGKGGVYAWVDVPVVPERVNPAQDPDWEVRVDW